jgi:hypothetical protein
MQTLFIFKLEQSSQLLRSLLITTTLASLALGHSILATYFQMDGFQRQQDMVVPLGERMVHTIQAQEPLLNGAI